MNQDPANQPQPVEPVNPVQPVEPAQVPPAMTAPQVQPVVEDPGKTLGIVGLVLSIRGGGLISLIISIIARNKSKAAGFKNTMATIGIVLSAIGIVVSLLMIPLVMTAYKGIQEETQKQQSQSQTTDEATVDDTMLEEDPTATDPAQ